MSYSYDGGSSSSSCKNQGRLTSVSSAVATSNYSCYDELGRVSESSQTMAGGTAREFSYSWNADGTLESVTYPSDRQVAYQYDAAGRLKAVEEDTVGATDYAGAIGYAPQGGMTSLTLGNGIYESWGYNAHLQPTAIRLGTAAGGSEKLSLALGYGTTSNNGNLLTQTIDSDDLAAAVKQSYTYDDVNRLASVTEKVGTAKKWDRTYGYDDYGNRWVEAGSANLFVQTPQLESDFDATTNRLTTAFGASYDTAGNQTGYDNTSSLLDWTAAYDGENRQRYFCDQTSTACGSSNATAEYVYDGEGQRVQKITATVTTTYVYDALGRLAAEYSSETPTESETLFRTQDHLGSTRMVTKADKSIALCRDFFPFGEQIPASSSYSGRDQAACYGGSATAFSQQFTSQQRDEEAKLDYFGARYYRPLVGRFTSPDGTVRQGQVPDPFPETPPTEMVGSSAQMVEVYKTISRAAPTDAPVLVEGESGTGKELVARLIHRNSLRRQGPFVPVDCGSIAPTIMESELFGSLRGAFTGADRDRKRLIESAKGGTVLLDEIAEVDTGFQLKLLRFLQEKEIRPLGSSVSRRVDVRVVAATNRNLQALVEEGKFRQDLWFRLNVVHIHLPPLRERRSDIGLLANHFLELFNSRYERNVRLADGGLKALEEHAWPGNVRQLQHVLERLLILSPVEVLEGDAVADALSSLEPRSKPVQSLVDAEEEQIRKVLTATGGNKTRAAQILNIERKTLYRKLGRMKLDS